MGQVLFRVFKSIKMQEKKQGQHSAIFTEQAWSLKDLLYGQKENFFMRKKMLEILSRQDGPIFLVQVANQNAVFASSCPLVTQLYIYNSNNIYYELSSKGKVCFCLCFFLSISIGSTDQWPLVHFLLTVFSM